jgi:SNF2 family DNA or RNA helicase
MSIKNLRERISPFIMRRTKANVMAELPEKIILDYSCVKTNTQELLHKLLNEHFPFIQDTSSKHNTGNKKSSHLESNFFHK